MTLDVLIVRLWRLVFLGRRVIVYMVSLEECSSMSLLYEPTHVLWLFVQQAGYQVKEQVEMYPEGWHHAFK
jgi:hypothetical protein